MSDLNKKRDDLFRLNERECFGLYQSEIDHMKNGFLKGFDAAADELGPKLEKAIECLEWYSQTGPEDSEWNRAGLHKRAAAVLKEIKGDGAK